MIQLDGSMGEGGGQILRSALGLSMVTGKPFRIEKIRAGREKPGLLRQHLTAVKAAAEISQASVSGAELGSRAITFQPGKVRPGEYRFAVGSAGSTTLILQAILPGLLTATGEVVVTLEGGTHNPFAPPFDFLDKAFLPIVRKMGADVQLTLHRAGFAPAGGGKVELRVKPAALSPVHLTERGPITRRRFAAVSAALAGEIGRREINVAQRAFDWPAEAYEQITLPDEWGPGNLVSIEIESEHLTEVFTAFGQRSTRAEAVAEDAIQQTKRYLAAGVPVGECLADQLLVPMALAGGGAFVTQGLTRHTTTNIDVVQSFLQIKINANEEKSGKWTVTF